jgi:putative nucleotidyltransferase with HDIG domain
MHRRELVFVADDRSRAVLPKTVADLAVRPVDWQDAKALASVGDAALLVDVDLRNASKVKTVKDSLPSAADNACRIVAVDRGNHLAVAQANGLGASDLIHRPFDIYALKAILQRHFPPPAAEDDPPASFSHPELKKAPGGASIIAAANELHSLFSALTRDRPLELAKVTQAADEIIESIGDVGLTKWLNTVRQYHESTYQHCLIVTGVSTAFGTSHGMRKSDVLILTIAGLLHDIGKAQIPLDILDKPWKLTSEEFEVIKRHPAIGYDYLCSQNTVISPEVFDVVRHHHEYLDGSGYPDGLQGQQIKDLTRILTICDVYGALVERRPYRAPKSAEMALDILTDMAQDGKVEYDLVRALATCTVKEH